MPDWLPVALIAWPPALAALVWGWRRTRLRLPPTGAMRSLQLGEPIAEPARKLAVARQQGWMAIACGVALAIGPMVAR